MYNVLIVDDEPMIREGLRTLIDWTSYGFDVIDIARDGHDALEKYKNHKIDLIVADIRMPGMDGIKLIETIRSLDKYVHFIILSGYAEFEYAKKAIQSNVSGYLLKPVEEEELIDFVKKIKTSLDQENSIKSLETTNRNLKRIQLLKSIIDTNEESMEKSRELQLDLELESTNYRLILIKQIDNKQIELTDLKILLQHDIDTNWGYIFTKDQFLGILLLDNHLRQDYYNEFYNNITNSRNHSKIIIYISKIFTNLFELKKAYEKGSSILNQHFFYKEGRYFTSESEYFIKQGSTVGLGTNEFPLNTFTESIYYALEVSNEDAIKQELLDAAQTMVNLKQTEEEVKRNFIRLLSAIISKCSLNKPELKDTLTDLSSDVLEINFSITLQTLLEFANRILIKISSALNIGNQQDQLKKLVDFIERNYQENLKLETLAKLFNYNSAYLGKIFKNHTGEYFNTFLDKVRIEKAKEMLSQGMKVYQVAEQVGYSNVDYFHNKFKKYVGMSPSTFRKKNQS